MFEDMKSKRVRIWLVAAFTVVFFLFILYSSQPARPVPDPNLQTPSFSVEPSATPNVIAAATIEEDPACKRPYPDSSIWNVPLDWSVAKIHPASDLMMDAFFKSDDWIGADTSKFTPNMYWVTNSTPLVPVQLLENRFRDALDDQQLQYGE